MRNIHPFHFKVEQEGLAEAIALRQGKNTY